MKTLKRIEKLTEATKVAVSDLQKPVVVADVATDHGYLAENLSKQDWVKKVIATDISDKCLNKLVDLIKKHDLKKIETIVGDGLNPIESADVAVIAGVGGFEIIKMLDKQNDNLKCKIFVLQPAQNALELREWLFDNEVFVQKDYIIEDAGRFYPIIIVDVSKKQINEKTIFNMWIGRDNEKSNKDFVLFLKDYLQFLVFLEDLPKSRIEEDDVLKDKLKLKHIIEKMLEEWYTELERRDLWLKRF